MSELRELIKDLYLYVASSRAERIEGLVKKLEKDNAALLAAAKAYEPFILIPLICGCERCVAAREVRTAITNAEKPE